MKTSSPRKGDDSTVRLCKPWLSLTWQCQKRSNSFEVVIHYMQDNQDAFGRTILVGCSPPFMRPDGRTTALRAWRLVASLIVRRKPKALRPDLLAIQLNGLTTMRCNITSHPPPLPSSRIDFSSWAGMRRFGDTCVGRGASHIDTGVCICRTRERCSDTSSPPPSRWLV